MHRCLELAALAAEYTAPNPMVGAVLVYNDRIIGEGYHKIYGEAHAEVNCIQSVKAEDVHLIPNSTLYVSLEPCAHFGKTPPCTDLILANNIKHVIVGCRDPFKDVNGKGIDKLKTNGVNVEVGIMEAECKQLNKRFFTFHTQHRPYITLKWAQSADSKIANSDYSRVKISNHFTNRLVHKWRSEEMSILIGTNTAKYDNPELTTRLWPGKNPVRLVVDMELKLPLHLKLFNSDASVIIFNKHQHTLPLENMSSTDVRNIKVGHYQVTENVSIVHQIINALYHMNINSVLVEGGGMLLQSFIDEDVWDEARVIINNELSIPGGLQAPRLNSFKKSSNETMLSDSIHYYSSIHSL
jgi:diaminohydroxyphosphoribosylaminopyrimidine deaminase / 5-amino-6-(5-phosphoribosylamino)uracil reductase